MKHLFVLIALLWFSCLTACKPEREVHLASPDGRLQWVLRVTPGGVVVHGVRWRGGVVVSPSPLGLVTADGDTLGRHSRLVGSTPVRVHDGWWRPAGGERSRYRDHYRGITVDLTERGGLRWRLEVRAYDEGVAFRYLLPRQRGYDTLHITEELTTCLFPAGAQAWVTSSAQGLYRHLPVALLRHPTERPLVVDLPGDTLFMAVGEAALVDQARMRLTGEESGRGVRASLDGGEVFALPAATAWRYLMPAATPGQLVENNYLLLNLNAPCALDDTSWIRPGKVLREITLTTRGGKACVDFAVSHGLQFVEFDAGWYGYEYSDTSDATTVTVDPRRSPGPLDLKEVIRYARGQGVGVILYVNRRALERQLDTLLPLYASWGVSGVKYGFVRVGSQRWTAWLHEAVRKAAHYRLMVDIHDEYRPTGYRRTYPNLMTCEGVRGDEASPDNTQTLITLFTRSIAGPTDHTICYFNERVTGRMRSSHASQLAKAICFYSPWQFLYWYDRPAASRGDDAPATLNGVIAEVPELELFRHLPTVWDETRVLDGRIGEYATFARRRGDEWYIGSLTGEEAHRLTLRLDMLDRDRRYRAFIYTDDPAVKTLTHVHVTEKVTGADSVLTFTLPPNRGLALRIVPDKISSSK